MNRRAVLALAGAAWPLLAHSQQPGRGPVVAFVSPNARATAAPFADGFVQRLRDHGWADGRTVSITYGWGDERSESTTEIIEGLVRRKEVDVIVTHGVPNILAAKRATATIPIVFALATDPIGSGFVGSLARPGGNVTGLSIQAPDLSAKRLALLREVVPALRRLAVLGDPGSVLETEEEVAAAGALGLDVMAKQIHGTENIGPAFAQIEGRADALYVCAVPLLNTNRAYINQLALAGRLPTVYGFREAVQAGALMSYGPSISDLFRRTADYVDKILRGAKPGDIPVEQPTKFELVFNLVTAKALGLAIPPSLLAQADEVIE